MKNLKKMIDETELMLSDWIYLTEKKTNARVTELYSNNKDAVLATDKGDVEMRIDIRPIPLTEDILLKNGFKKCDIFGDSTLFLRDGEIHITVHFRSSIAHSIEIRNQFKRVGLKNSIIYVHELQHVMRLCGIEKEIEL